MFDIPEVKEENDEKKESNKNKDRTINENHNKNSEKTITTNNNSPSEFNRLIESSSNL